jgi:hypothetical protein
MKAKNVNLARPASQTKQSIFSYPNPFKTPQNEQSF